MVALCLGNDLALAVDEGVDDGNLLPGGILVVHLHPAVVDIDAPMLYMDGIGLCEPYVPINAAARVPAAVGLVAVVHTHSHHVVALTDVGCDVVLEGTVAVGTEAHLLTVDIDSGVHIDTVELEEEFKS